MVIRGNVEKRERERKDLNGKNVVLLLLFLFLFDLLRMMHAVHIDVAGIH